MGVGLYLCICVELISLQSPNRHQRLTTWVTWAQEVSACGRKWNMPEQERLDCLNWQIAMQKPMDTWRKRRIWTEKSCSCQSAFSVKTRKKSSFSYWGGLQAVVDSARKRKAEQDVCSWGSVSVWSWFNLEVSCPMVKVRVSVGGLVLGPHERVMKG